MEEDKVTLAVETANTELKEILNQALLFGYSKSLMKEMIRVLIIKTENELKELGASEQLISNTRIGLKQTFMRQYIVIVRMLEEKAKKQPLGPLGKVLEQIKSDKPFQMSNKGGITIDKINLIGQRKNDITPQEINDVLGIAQANIDNLRDYMVDYELGAAGRFEDYTNDIEQTIVEVTDKIADGSLSATMIQNRNGRDVIVHKSIRNMAEIETRYQTINKDLNKLKDRGIKFVVASSHADASERCQWWQGKIFLMDLDDINTRPMGEYKGSKPKQDVLGHIDGKPYYSLKQACENGFLSFNCQHHLVAYYKGIAPRHYDFVTVNKKRELTTEQRMLESKIRQYKARTDLSVKGVKVNRKNPNTGEFEVFTQRQYNMMMSKYYQDKYKAFCKANNLPEYRWRTRISQTEREFKT